MGDELLRVLRPPLTETGLDQIDLLIAQRESALEQAGALLAQGVELGELRAELNSLLQQQQEIERQLQELLTALRTHSVKAQSTRAHLAGVQRVLGREVKSRLMDQRG